MDLNIQSQNVNYYLFLFLFMIKFDFLIELFHLLNFKYVLGDYSNSLYYFKIFDLSKAFYIYLFLFLKFYNFHPIILFFIHNYLILFLNFIN
jgi:hypothetical protein